MTSSDPEFAMIMSYFNQSKPKNYGIKNILFVHNPILSKIFEAQLEQTEMGAKNFPPSWKDEEPKQERAATILRWKKQTDQFSPIQLATSERTQLLVATRVVPLWHGTNKAEAICTSGFAFFGKHHLLDNKAGPATSTDVGYFGSGIYFTNSAQYASMYNADKVGGTLLLALASMREPYPVVSDVTSPNKGSDMRKLEGRGAYQNYNAHYIPVTSADPRDPENMVYYPCHKSEQPAWDEYVVFNAAQTLPQFQIELGVDFPATILPSAGAGAPGNTIENLLDKILELLDSSQIQADKDLTMVLSRKSDALASLNLKNVLSSQDQEFYNWALKLLDPVGKLRNVVKQKLVQPSAAPSLNKLEHKESPLVPLLTEKALLELYTKASIGDAKALQELRAQAEFGRAIAQCYLGTMYRKGEGVSKDEREATRLYKLASDKGFALARGYMYSNGLGVGKDEREAFRWYKQAAEQANAAGQYNLGWVYANGRGVGKDESEAVRWYKQAAEQGYAQAQSSLGHMYSNGLGIGKDEREAFRWYKLAAEQGFVQAKINLGWMYTHGKGVGKDEQEAFRWYKQAAEQGHANAQVSLGLMYKNGRGVGKDEREAVRFYRLAAEQGDALGQYNLGWMYANGQGITKDEREAVSLYRLAAEQGNAQAQCNLGWTYQFGQGVGKDEREAVKWYKLAAKQGDAKAQTALKRLGIEI